MAEEDKTASAGEEIKVSKPPGCLGWFFLLLLVLVVGAVLYFSLRFVGPKQVGLRVVKEGLGLWTEGPAAAKPLPPGWHPILPWFQEFVKYDKSIQKFEMTDQTGGIRVPDHGAIEIRTSDGYRVKVDITILYHVLEGKANLLPAHYKSDQDIRNIGINALCPGILQNKLSELEKAEDFYSSDLRVKKAEEAVAEMNKFFAPLGLQVLDVLIRDFQFPEQYEEAILRKVLADQLQQVQEALARAAGQEAVWKRIIAEGDRDAEAERARGTAETRRLDAEADKMRVERAAEGDRRILEAQAQGRGQISSALAGRGGKAYVGLEYAKTLEGVELIVLPTGPGGVNPLDVEQMLKLFDTK